MDNIKELQELLRETRIQKGLSYKDLKQKTKIPTDIIQRLEEDTEFVEKNVYARMFFKQLLRELGINAQIKTYDKKPEVQNENSVSETAGKFINASVGLTALSGLIFMSLAFKPATEENLPQAYKIILETKLSDSQNKTQIEVEQQENIVEKAKSITLHATSDVWITATVDGEMEVINLKAGESTQLSFLKKIVFETIGNAKALKMNFNDREIVIRKEIVHNLFVDAQGIFLNGYNLIEDTEKS